MRERTRPMSDQRTPWVFTPREDLVVMLLLPALAGLGLVALFSLAGWDVLDDDDSVSFFVFVLGDHTHLYVSVAISAGFADERARRRWFYRLAPPLILALLLSMNAYSEQLFFSFFALYSVLHFVKQELGWMIIAARKGGARDRLDLFVDKLALYAVTALPVVFYFAAHEKPGWFRDGDFPKLPASLDWPLFLLWLFGVVAYPAWFFLRRRRAGWRGYGKLFIWAKNALLWSLTFMFWYRNVIWGLAVLTLSHAVPYIYLGFKFGRRKLERSLPWAPEGTVLRILKWAWIGAMLLATAHYFVEVYPDYVFPAAWLAWIRRYALLPTFASLTVFHYVLDSFFWRREHNPDAVF